MNHKPIRILVPIWNPSFSSALKVFKRKNSIMLFISSICRLTWRKLYFLLKKSKVKKNSPQISSSSGKNRLSSVWMIVIIWLLSEGWPNLLDFWIEIDQRSKSLKPQPHQNKIFDIQHPKYFFHRISLIIRCKTLQKIKSKISFESILSNFNVSRRGQWKFLEVRE